jgi:acetylornithine/succinyldiaminopimelate/putrescine aminotransferase
MGRTGKVFMYEHLCEPDIIATAKGAVVGLTLADARLSQYLHGGWHSNTFGSGRVFDINMAHATLSLLNYTDPQLGIGYLENSTKKGEYLMRLLKGVQGENKRSLLAFNTRGLMASATVRHRDLFVEYAWTQGLKLLGTGGADADGTGKVRLIFLVDALAREIEEFAVIFGKCLKGFRKTLKDSE